MKYDNKEDLINQIKEFVSQREKFKIVNINGEFLTGKTSAIQELITDIDFINQYNVYSYVNDWEKYNYLFDITSDFFENSNLQHPEFTFNESKYFVKSFFDTLGTLNISNKELFNEVNEYLLIENSKQLDDSLKSKIQSSVKNDLKKNLLLNYFEISIECLIADLLNNFFPLNNQIESLSDYLLSREPIKILLIFDDAQSVSPKIEKWFELFFSYMTTKKLGDLLLYDYKGKDTQIKLGEFFTIDLLYISRNKSLNLVGNDIRSELLELKYPQNNELTETYKELLPDVEIVGLPILGIPTLADFYSQIEEEKDNSTAIYAVNHLLKYVPTEYQRLIIFASLFDEFTLKELNLFEEIELNEMEFNKLISDLDFISNSEHGYKLNEKSKILLFAVYQLIFEELDSMRLINISNTLKSHFHSFSNIEFELIRELAYFKNFDKSFILEHYFNNDRNLTQLLENRTDMFDKDKSFYSLKSEYSIVLMEYNKIRDRVIKDDKKNRIENLNSKYKAEIEKRNKVLQDDVINVGNEIKEFINEKELMDGESEDLGKISISLRNEINEIDNNLKPFIHQNSKQKSTINFVALIVSVAIIFNSDRIAELIFGNSSDFDLVIIITFLLLIVLYGNGLLRYFRVKFKSEELHTLKQSKSNKEKEYEKLASELEILNADIRAKDSKIEDLKKHIERMNKQIFENKQKLEKSSKN
ncbi:MAG: hypothetical protein CVV25_11260 [Ignavibacteriae bacterium HGW-Ignavibacteriae-4]|jgi:peptidoglycan hydrolase CwlO-like protein|nr:MAG: hypothetical protein CVV25_11260 [Ignavibacteriae bacterium HGW-Ignavibacteriae-4]